MGTPVLTKSQQKKTLSAKKTPNKGLKNILVQPQDDFWPILKNDPAGTFENLLKRLLPDLKQANRRKIPWSKLRKMNKEERTAARKALESENEENHDNPIAKSVILGINAVTRSLEKNQVCCILLDANIDPPLMVKHIVTMSQSKCVPVLLITFLKTVTLEAIGFSCAALGLKHDVVESSDHKLHTIFSKVSDLCLDLALPKIGKSLFPFDDTIMNESSVAIKDDYKCSQKVSEKCSKPIISTNVYLYRVSKSERVFVPEKLDSKPKWDDYIALSKDNEDIEVPEKLPSRFFLEKRSINEKDNAYMPLKVKRVKGNEKRIKATKPPKSKRNKK